MTIFFLTGASGVGKTSLVNALKKRHNDWTFYHFDSMGVPSVDEMIAKHGSVENWQKTMTEKWVDEIVACYQDQTVILEGQVNLDFVETAFLTRNFKDYQIVLVDCDNETMKSRLTSRNQPELYTQDMQNWLGFLRKQAKEKDAYILNSSKKLHDLIDEFEPLVDIQSQ